MTWFEWFFRCEIFNLAVTLLPASEKCTKTATKYLQNSKKVVSTIKLEK